MFGMVRSAPDLSTGPDYTGIGVRDRLKVGDGERFDRKPVLLRGLDQRLIVGKALLHRLQPANQFLFVLPQGFPYFLRYLPFWRSEGQFAGHHRKQYSILASEVLNLLYRHSITPSSYSSASGSSGV